MRNIRYLKIKKNKTATVAYVIVNNELNKKMISPFYVENVEDMISKSKQTLDHRRIL